MAKFKLSFKCVKIQQPGNAPLRALIMAIQPMPHSLGWLNCVMACEDGTTREFALTMPEFEGAREIVTLVEVDDVRAPVILYPTQTEGKST